MLRYVKTPKRASCRQAARAQHAPRRPSCAWLCACRRCGKASKLACAVPERCLLESRFHLASCLIGQRLRECCWTAWRSGPAAAGPGVLRASGCASMLCGCSEGAPGRRRLFGERLGIFVSRLPLQCLSTSQCHRNAETLVTLKVAGKLRVFPALTSRSDGFFIRELPSQQRHELDPAAAMASAGA